MSIAQLLHIIVSECRNSCTDAASTTAYFYKHYPTANHTVVKALAQGIDFSKLRENEMVLYGASAT